jgi:exodeoxyribonuclease V alpha subunit
VKEEIGVYLRQYARHITDHDDIDKIFHAFDSFRVLCATRAGLFGVDFLNGIMEGFLKNDMDVPPNRFLYPGKAIMITENDYARQLFNGDIGILLSDPEAPDHWSFYFRTLENTNLFRKVSPYSLPGHETAFAITIHKSQGSEYDQIFLFLPQHHSPVLTRELLYTGITRSKKGLAIVAAKDIFTAALAHRNRRHSGLTEKLRKG